MTFKATDLPAEERDGKSVSELDTNIKKILVHSSEELHNRPWCKVISLKHHLYATSYKRCYIYRGVRL